MRCLVLVLPLLLALPIRGAVIAFPSSDYPSISEEQFRTLPIELQKTFSDLKGGTENLGLACMAMECQKNGQPDCPIPPDGYVTSQKLCDDLKAILGQSLKLNRHSKKKCDDGTPPIGSRAMDSTTMFVIRKMLELVVPWPFSMILDYIFVDI